MLDDNSPHEKVPVLSRTRIPGFSPLWPTHNQLRACSNFACPHLLYLQRLLRSTGAGWQAGAKAPAIGVEGSDPMVLPLWVEVTKEGLQTRIVFHGEWVFTNHLPQEVQVRELYTAL